MSKPKKPAAHTLEVMAALDAYYGTDYMCSLDHRNAWQLLIATILSAQCTDARVNIVTRDLFVKYPSVQAFADADLAELEQDIHATGFYHNKAKNIIACCQMLMERHGGEVPSDIDELTALPGVGRKTANVIRGNIYNIPSIVVDTHVKRISRKLGVSKSDDPTIAERELMAALPEDHWIIWNMQLITFGREICKAPTPKCEECFMTGICPDYRARCAKPAGKRVRKTSDADSAQVKAGRTAGKPAKAAKTAVKPTKAGRTAGKPAQAAAAKSVGGKATHE